MRNLILIILEVIVCYVLMIVLYKKYKTDGLYTFGIIATTLSCVMSLKQVDIFGVAIPFGFGVTTSTLIAGNVIIQKKEYEDLKKYIIIILITLIINCIFFNLSGIIQGSEYNKYANESYNIIFKFNLRTYIALIVSLISSILLSNKILTQLKKIQTNIVINNLFSIIIVELLENIFFVLITYLFEYSPIDIILMIIFRYMIKTIIGILGIIPISIINKFN